MNTSHPPRGRLLLLCAFLALGIASQAFAQIRDDQESADYLKAQILKDTGGAGNYDSYSRNLAKTLSHLTPEQQKAVFENVIDPSAPSTPGGGIRPEVQNRIDKRIENGMPMEGRLFVDNLISQDLPLTPDEWAGILAIPEQPSDAELLRLTNADISAGGPGGP